MELIESQQKFGQNWEKRSLGTWKYNLATQTNTSTHQQNSFFCPKQTSKQKQQHNKNSQTYAERRWRQGPEHHSSHASY